jgi:hypothetical protein
VATLGLGDLKCITNCHEQRLRRRKSGSWRRAGRASCLTIPWSGRRARALRRHNAKQSIFCAENRAQNGPERGSEMRSSFGEFRSFGPMIAPHQRAEVASVASSGEPSIVTRTFAPKEIVIIARGDVGSSSAAVGATVTGTKAGKSRDVANCCRQRYSRLRSTPAFLATSVAFAPGSIKPRLASA